MEKNQRKISPVLRERLQRLKPRAMIAAIVVTKGPAFEKSRRRLKPAQRKSRIAERRAATQRMRAVITRLLADENQGRVLGQDSGALGSIVVYATPKGLERLAAEPDVEAILEDQKVRLSPDLPEVEHPSQSGS